MNPIFVSGIPQPFVSDEPGHGGAGRNDTTGFASQPGTGSIEGFAGATSNGSAGTAAAANGGAGGGGGGAGGQASAGGTVGAGGAGAAGGSGICIVSYFGTQAVVT